MTQRSSSGELFLRGMFSPFPLHFKEQGVDGLGLGFRLSLRNWNKMTCACKCWLLVCSNQMRVSPVAVGWPPQHCDCVDVSGDGGEPGGSGAECSGEVIWGRWMWSHGSYGPQKKAVREFWNYFNAQLSPYSNLLTFVSCVFDVQALSGGPELCLPTTNSVLQHLTPFQLLNLFTLKTTAPPCRCGRVSSPILLEAPTVCWQTCWGRPPSPYCADSARSGEHLDEPCWSYVSDKCWRWTYGRHPEIYREGK